MGFNSEIKKIEIFNVIENIPSKSSPLAVSRKETIKLKNSVRKVKETDLLVWNRCDQ